MKKIILIIAIYTVCYGSNAQGGSEAILSLWSGFDMAKSAENAAQYAELIATSKQIYDAYKKTLKLVETVSTSVRTAKEVQQTMKDIGEIIELYDKYGMTIKLNTLYDLDKYLNPELQEQYAQNMLILLQSCKDNYNTLSDILTDDKLKMGDKDRLDEIRRLNHEVRRTSTLMKRMISNFQSMFWINYDQESTISVRKSMWDYNNYAE